MKNQYLIIPLVLILIIGLLFVRGCQRTKEIEIKQKSSDEKTKISLEVKKQPQYE